MEKRFFSQKMIYFIIFALTLIISLSSSSALVQVSPASSNLNLCSGDIFSINLSISGVSNVYGFQFDMGYNSSALEPVSVLNGTFLSNFGQNSVYCIQPNLSAPGLIRNIACSRIGESGSTPNSGVLATISFRIRSVPGYPTTSSFMISNLKLSDIDSEPLGETKADGQTSIDCTCVEGEIASCNDANGCPGNRTCSDGTLGACITSTLFFCDSNCDGTSECRAQACAACQCTGSTPVSCTTSDGCPGTRSCTNGVLGACQITGYYCDADCDGDNETCRSTACADCGCIVDWDCDAWSTCSDKEQTRTCTDVNDCGEDEGKPIEIRDCRPTGSGGSGGGSSLPPRCVEQWTCGGWNLCGLDGFRRRTCSDASLCGTSANKPNELETCLYVGNCNDGIMNGQEEGIDCGGSCAAACPQLTEESIPLLSFLVEPVQGDILDRYIMEVNVENLGEQELLDVKVVASKWSADETIIQSILPGTTELVELVLSLPTSPDESSVDVQLVYEGVVVATQSVPVTLSVPEFSVKINQDPELEKTMQAIIVDNRDKPARTLDVDITIIKGKETYLIETGKTYDVEENSLFHQVDYLYKALPAGQYEVKATFYENGEKVAESTSEVTLGGDKKALNVKYFFYFLLLAIVVVSGYVFFISGKKLKEI